MLVLPVVLLLLVKIFQQNLLGAKDIDVARAIISTVVPAVFEGAVNPLAAKTWKGLVGNPKFADLK
jgi:hypothetical protein